MCFQQHLEPPGQAKMFQVYSYCKKGQKGSEGPLTMGVHSHDRNAEASGGQNRRQFFSLPGLRGWRCCHFSLFSLRNLGRCVNDDRFNPAPAEPRARLRSWLSR